jgi:3-phenylpropionate/cinnamic acid dioxygenase small subunit
MMNIELKEQIRPSASSAPMPDLRAIETFIQDEVRLLDERRFEDWMELFAEDGIYWAPTMPRQQNPHRTVSLFYDNKSAMQARIARLRHPRIYVQMPPSRTRHVVSGFRIENDEAPANECAVSSNFIMLEYRPGYEQRVFGGGYLHRLRFSDGRLRIVLKRAELINCDASFRSMAVPF